MKFILRPVCFIVFIFLPFQAVFAQSKVWEPIPQTELQMKTPQVEATADAEVLFWEVRIVDKYNEKTSWETTINHHLRIKIFTERGRDTNSKVDIPFGKVDRLTEITIKDLIARTIKPDGSIIEVKPEEIFERDIVKGNGVKVKAKSFAMPGIEAGAIIEYRWKEIRTALINYIQLELAREIPVQYVKYYIRPVPTLPVGMRLHSFNTDGGFTKEKDGFYSTTMRNVPAIKKEPRMPSEYDIKPWVLVFYESSDEKQSAENYWKAYGKNIFEIYKEYLKPNSDVKNAAVQAIGNATETEEKVRRIFDFCRQKIKNVYEDESGLTPDQLKEIRVNRTPADTLKRGTGDWQDIDLVFTSMLLAVGIDARIAKVAVRTDPHFNKEMTNLYFIRTEIIAVKIGEKWRFFDPSYRYLPFGMLGWVVEGQDVLVSDSDKPFWEKTTISAAAQSNQKRTAKIRLSDDGSLEGDVKIEFTGHLADSYREYIDDDSQIEREKYLTETIRRQIGNTTEVTAISIENLGEAEKPLVYSFKIKVPAYAERTGKRLFLRPNIFKRNTNSVFTAGTRKYDISFDYAWSENDEIAIELPKGYSLETADSPKPVLNDRLGGSQETKISVSDDKKMLFYQRNFSFGKTDSLSFNTIYYSAIRGLFNSFQTADSHSLILREDSPATN